jgi:hypothetical protein
MRAMHQQRWLRLTTVWIVAVACVELAVVLHARGAEPLSYSIDARIDLDRRAIEGALHCDVSIAEGEDHIRLWLLPDRNAVEPSYLDERNARWIYPGEPDLGSMDVWSVRIEDQEVESALDRDGIGGAGGRDFRGADLIVRVPPGPARRVDLRLRFRIRLPERFGRLGVIDDRLSLNAPWYPIVIGDDGGWSHSVPQRVRVATTEPLDMVIAGREARPGRTVEFRGPYAPVFAAPELYRSARRIGDRTLVVVSADRLWEPPPADAEGLEALHDVIEMDRVGLLEEATTDVLETLDGIGFERPDGAIVAVLVPSRTELAATAPGTLLLSDRIYEIFPLDIVEDFHQRAVRRALFRLLAGPLASRIEPVIDRPWAVDLRAAFLTDVDDARRHGHARTPEELVGFASFHPAVDQLLYAPQVAFIDTFFGSVVEPDPYRDDPARARAPIARGRQILETIRDNAGEEGFEAFTGELLASRVSSRAALEDTNPTLAPRLDEWLVAPGTELNYRLGEVESTASGAGYRHRVEVFREGSERRERVEVEIEDDDDHLETAVWDAEGERGEVTIETAAELDDVLVDPRGRLAESPRVADGHPRGDNASSQPWRLPLLRGFGLNLLLSEADFAGFIDFALRRRYELDESIAATLAINPAAYSVSLRYIWGVGPARHTNSRIGAISAGLSAARIREGFVEDAIGGWRVSLLGSAGWDEKAFREDPRSGSALSVNGRVGLVVRDDDELAVSGSVGSRGSILIPLGLRNTLLLLGDVGWTFGESLPGENQALGGRFALRGFETGELVGAFGAYAVAEHRWTVLSDLAINIVHLAWLREVQLAVFLGGGIVADSIDGSRTLLGAEAGAGIRFHYEYGGIQPGVLAVDIGVPLTRKLNEPGTDGDFANERIPFGIHASFDQYF